jgi:hypothetical protein
MTAIGLPRKVHGVVVHDCWGSYFLFANFTHALCNVHILRELQHVMEMGSKWAELMKELLLNLLDEVEAYGGMPAFKPASPGN